MLQGFLSATAAVVALFGACFSTAAAADVVKLRVEDQSGRTSTEPLYLACPANGWNPGDAEWKLAPAETAKVPNSATTTWEFTFDLSRLPPDAKSIEFKFARGDWSKVEVDEKGRDVSNRSVEVATLRTATGGAVSLPPVKGYADQRGTRWPNMETPATPAARKSTVTGDLDILDAHSSILNNDRKVRVWMPPGYKDAANKDRRYPVFYMHDGQNCFDEATSAFGAEWQCDETATRLIKEGKIEPLIIVGIDNATVDRAKEYNPPYTTWQDKANIGDKYLAFLTTEVMPLIDGKYRTKTGPENTSLGGSSFGGNATVYAAIEKPGTFGRILVESPAMFIDGKKLLDRAKACDKWPSRIFLAVGTAETASAGEAEAFASLTRELAASLKSKGLGDDRLMVVIEEGAKHNEPAWAKRLPGAMEFLFRK